MQCESVGFYSEDVRLAGELRPGVVAGDGRGREERVNEDGVGNPRYPVQLQAPGSAGAERALGHRRQHPGARRELQHDVAGAQGGGAERGMGERTRGGELLEADLLLCALRARGFRFLRLPMLSESPRLRSDSPDGPDDFSDDMGFVGEACVGLVRRVRGDQSKSRRL